MTPLKLLANIGISSLQQRRNTGNNIFSVKSSGLARVSLVCFRRLVIFYLKCATYKSTYLLTYLLTTNVGIVETVKLSV